MQPTVAMLRRNRCKPSYRLISSVKPSQRCFLKLELSWPHPMWTVQMTRERIKEELNLIDWLFDWLIYVRVSTITAIWTVGHILRSTPTNGNRFTALSLPWRSPIQVLTEVDVTSLSDRVTEQALVATANLPRNTQEAGRLTNSLHLRGNLLDSFRFLFFTWCPQYRKYIDFTSDKSFITPTIIIWNSWTRNTYIETFNFRFYLSCKVRHILFTFGSLYLQFPAGSYSIFIILQNWSYGCVWGI